MTGHSRQTDTEPDSTTTPHGDIALDGGPAQDDADAQKPWLEFDSDGAGEMPRVLDAEIATAAKGLFFARDLVRPGPGLLPFGAKARARQEQRRKVDALAATRRAELTELLTTRRNTRSDRNHRAKNTGHPGLVAALLTAVVVAVAAAGWWMSQTPSPQGSPHVAAGSGSQATDLPTFEPGLTTTAATRPSTAGSVSPEVDLTSPERAAAAWLATWCPIDHRTPDDVATRVQSLMTDPGWAQFAATPGQTAPDPRPDVAASCDTPLARIVSRPSGSTTTVVVSVSATRTITDTTNPAAPSRFRIERRQYVVRGADGLWRVDAAAVGG